MFIFPTKMLPKEHSPRQNQKDTFNWFSAHLALEILNSERIKVTPQSVLDELEGLKTVHLNV